MMAAILMYAARLWRTVRARSEVEVLIRSHAHYVRVRGDVAQRTRSRSMISSMNLRSGCLSVRLVEQQSAAAAAAQAASGFNG